MIEIVEWFITVILIFSVSAMVPVLFLALWYDVTGKKW